MTPQFVKEFTSKKIAFIAVEWLIMEGAHIAEDQSSNATLLRPRKAICSVWRPDPGPVGGTHPSVASSIFKPNLKFL
jgi:hypothetical protein